MNSFQFLVCLFPTVFMLHDFEEIIFFKTWLGKNGDYLKERFPRISKKLLPGLEKLSTAGFAVAVAEELILLSMVTFGSIYFESYYLWLSIFMAFSIHLVVHVLQWIAVRRYIPAIVTSLLALPYCIYTLAVIVKHNMFQPTEIVLWTAIGMVLLALNLLLAHKLGEKFDLWMQKRR